MTWVSGWLDRDPAIHVYWLVPPSVRDEDVLADRERLLPARVRRRGARRWGRDRKPNRLLRPRRILRRRTPVSPPRGLRQRVRDHGPDALRAGRQRAGPRDSGRTVDTRLRARRLSIRWRPRGTRRVGRRSSRTLGPSASDTSSTRPTNRSALSSGALAARTRTRSERSRARGRKRARLRARLTRPTRPTVLAQSIINILRDETAAHTADGIRATEREDYALADLVYALRSLGYRDAGNPGTPVFVRK